MKPTIYQQTTLEKIRQGKSLLLVAPTGLGKTFAVTGDVTETFCKIVYAVPLRALGNDIRRNALEYKRNDSSIMAVVHHGGIQESSLFSEEFIVTTYDQVVCGVPGLPLSLPLKSGHAVAGALLMSRLIFDEAHLAWGISKQALSILFAIVKFRNNLGLQTVLMTATLPDVVSKKISEVLGLERILIGEGGEVQTDEALSQRDENRQVTPKPLKLEKRRDKDELDFSQMDNLLKESGQGKRIYFANTVERLQKTYDRLIQQGVDKARILVLHNRMPHAWRKKVEQEVSAKFGKTSQVGDWILLTNQVAEAGLDISAPLVISDPAPVDTLIQRVGRCARWFREGRTGGTFYVIQFSGLTSKTPSDFAKSYVKPYDVKFVAPAMRLFPLNNLSWKEEREWINKAWGGGEDEALKEVEKALNGTTFALNLFDRAAQERKPGEIARVFREILSIEVAVEEGNEIRFDDLAPRDLNLKINRGEFPDTSSISMGRAFQLTKEEGWRTAVIRYDREENQFLLKKPDTIQLGDILILPSSMAYLHKKKGLCFGEANEGDSDVILNSEWSVSDKNNPAFSQGLKHYQTLSEHSQKVMKGTYDRFTDSDNLYRRTLINILKHLEPDNDENQIEHLADLVANLARVAAGFHDFGKAHIKWQAKIREIDPICPSGLVGRSCITGKRIGIPHTPPGYVATIEACRLLLGISDGSHSLNLLIRAVALAACRHHSSLLNPARIERYKFQPHPDTEDFVREILLKIGASSEVLNRAGEIIEKAKSLPELDDVPLMLPNEDLFPIYALVGRAILIADREDASGLRMEQLG